MGPAIMEAQYLTRSKLDEINSWLRDKVVDPITSPMDGKQYYLLVTPPASSYRDPITRAIMRAWNREPFRPAEDNFLEYFSERSKSNAIIDRFRIFPDKYLQMARK